MTAKQSPATSKQGQPAAATTTVQADPPSDDVAGIAGFAGFGASGAVGAPAPAAPKAKKGELSTQIKSDPSVSITKVPSKQRKYFPLKGQ